ncbi:hypothetical protein KKE60_04820 [Patescibacteria group bacterium]|nr:hypothetical protein [Patescibacteria group bacterium]
MISKTEVDPQYIIGLVCDHYEVTMDEIKRQVRFQPVAKARQVAMYLISLYSDRTLVEIGVLLNRRTPATVHHAFVEIGTRILVDGDLSRDVKELREVIDGNNKMSAL